MSWNFIPYDILANNFQWNVRTPLHRLTIYLLEFLITPLLLWITARHLLVFAEFPNIKFRAKEGMY